VLSAFIKMNNIGENEINAIKQCLTHPGKHVAFQAQVALRNIMINARDA
jgi:vesicle coat complex subunit